MRHFILCSFIPIAALAACADAPGGGGATSPELAIIEDPDASVPVILCVTSWRSFHVTPEDGTLGASIDFEVEDLTNGDSFVVDGTPTITAAPFQDIDSFEEARAAAAGDGPGCETVWLRAMTYFDNETALRFTGLNTPIRAWRYAIMIRDKTDQFLEFNEDPPFPGGSPIEFTGPEFGARVYFMYVTSSIRGPGYWLDPFNPDWADTKIFPDDRLKFRFGPLPPGYDDWTFFQAISHKGGGKGTGQLLRHAAAAYLNASHPYINYPWNQEQIVAAVQAAIKAGGDAIEDQKDEFEKMNSVDEDRDENGEG